MGLADRSWVISLARYPGVALIIFLFGWHTLVLISPGGVENLSVLGQPIVQAILFEVAIVLVSMTGGLALLGISRGYGVLSRILESKPLLYMGAISYSFYLWHIIVMAAVKRLLMVKSLDQQPYSQALFLVVSLVIALAISTASYHLIEVRLTGRSCGPSSGRGRTG